MHHPFLGRLTAAVTAGILMLCAVPVTAADGGEIAHDPSRDIQTEGVGNPFQYGERNTPEDASTEEIRAINHKMSVQEVKYALFKEIDEHSDRPNVRRSTRCSSASVRARAPSAATATARTGRLPSRRASASIPRTPTVRSRQQSRHSRTSTRSS